MHVYYVIILVTGVKWYDIKFISLHESLNVCFIFQIKQVVKLINRITFVRTLIININYIIANHCQCVQVSRMFFSCIMHGDRKSVEKDNIQEARVNHYLLWLVLFVVLSEQAETCWSHQILWTDWKTYNSIHYLHEKSIGYSRFEVWWAIYSFDNSFYFILMIIKLTARLKPPGIFIEKKRMS